MDLLKKEFFNCLINFDTFSRLPPNTDIHLSKTGYFAINAGQMSGYLGAQTIANIYNGYTGDKLVSDLEEFINHVIHIMEQLIENDKDDIAGKIFILHRNVKYGYGNDEHGLYCLLKIYENTIHYNQLHECIFKLKDYVDNLVTPNHCPESNFTDKDWEYYLLNCTKLQYETIGFYKYYQYSSSLMFNQAMNYANVWNWYDMIYENNGIQIYLGAMPLKSNYSIENRNDLDKIRELGVKSVLSVVEVFENQTNGLINTPIKPSEWGDIKYLQLPISDFTVIPLDKVQICVEYINWNVKNNRSIYLNCRAGRQRSAFVLMCYMIKYLKFSSQEVFDYIKNKRYQVQNQQFKLLQEYEQLLLIKK